jgi:predicted AAA+ superfamily ATPase
LNIGIFCYTKQKLKILKLLKSKEGIIVTLEQFDKKIIGNRKVKLIPAWSLDFLEDKMRYLC